MVKGRILVPNKAIIALDFDGTLCSYAHGWEGADIIRGLPIDGALEFVRRTREFFDLEVFSSRARFNEGADAISEWLFRHKFPQMPIGAVKPPAFLIIDDRTLLFKGVWPPVEYLLKFVPWYAKHTDAELLEPKAWARDWDAEMTKERERLAAKEERMRKAGLARRGS